MEEEKTLEEKIEELVKLMGVSIVEKIKEEIRLNNEYILKGLVNLLEK